MREGYWLGMVIQGGQGLDGLLESEVQCDPPVSQVAQLRNHLAIIPVLKRQELGGAEIQDHPWWQSKSEVGMGFLRRLTTLKK